MTQINGLIQIQNHSRPLAIIENQFQNNNGLKGIINIEVNEDSIYGILIHKNQFVKNSAVMEANVINIRKRAKNVLQLDYSKENKIECGGIELSSNLFKSNVGCSHTNGAVYAYCYDIASSPLITKSYHLDSQYFTGNMFHSALLSQNPFNLYAIHNENLFTAYTKYTVGDQEIKVNKYKVNLINNTYTANFAGSKRSVIQINGFTLVKSQNELYQNNENWFARARELYSSFTQMKVAEKVIKYSTTLLQGYEHKA